MRYLTIGQASLCTLLSVSSLFNQISAWPTYNLHNSQFAKRQSSESSPPGGVEEEPTFNEEYDFVIAGGKLLNLEAHV